MIPPGSQLTLSRRAPVEFDLTHKTCARCQRQLPHTAFRANPKLKCGLNSYCIECSVELTRLWRAPNRKTARKWNGYLTQRNCEFCGATFKPWDFGGRFCSHRCAGLSRRKPGRTDSQRNRLSAAKRGYGSRWQRLRKAFLLLNPWCEKCGKVAEDVDHIVPLSRGGGNDLANLRALCEYCHCRRHALDRSRAA
jgi:5-methylcytosine-specific restriction protein A